MPYRSKSQMAFMHANVGKKGITKKMVKEFDQASKGKKLPEKVKPSREYKFRKYVEQSS